MAVEAVLGDVQLTSEEPLRVGSLPLEDLVERLAPLERFRLLRPEVLEVTFGALVDAGVVGVGSGGEPGWRREGAVLLGERLERRGAPGPARHRITPVPVWVPEYATRSRWASLRRAPAGGRCNGSAGSGASRNS